MQSGSPESTTELTGLQVEQATVNINSRNLDIDFQPSVIKEPYAVNVDEILQEFSDDLLATSNQEFAIADEPVVLQQPVASVLEFETAKVSDDVDREEKESESELYAGTSKKLGLVLLIICSLSIRFKLSDEALSYVISLIAMILPPGNNMIKSVYALKEYLKQFVSFPTIHYLCSSCGTHVTKNSKTCSNQYCVKDLTEHGAIGYFIQHSIINQLQLMCRRSGFMDKIRSHRFSHYKRNPEKNLRDVYDGSSYRKAYDNGFLKDPNSVSFSLNTDGVQIFKSSVVSMWPVYMMINELPSSERKLKENIVYYGLWISSKKPIMWSFLKPLHDEMCKLEDGVNLKDNNEKEFTMKATIINCVCDLPARCMVSNSMQFNGKYGCWYCLQPGETYTTNKGGHVHIYPYKENDPKEPQRTTENLEHDVNQVVKNVQNNKKDYIVNGIKGPFWFMFLKHFNVIHGFVIDYMHGICAGVMKMLLLLWFDKQHKQEQFSVINLKSIVSDRLKAINPNLSVTRPPRSLDELGHWKSSEFRNFLFLWSLSVLYGILPDPYYMHYCLLVQAIYNLCKENITEAELVNAEKCLLKFVEHFEKLYSSRYLTMNMHQLVHITDCVRANGPLFANNCFVFEDLNGYILKHIHGPTGVEMQIINALTKMQAIPSMIDIYVEKESPDEAFINSILKPNYIHDGTSLEIGIYLLGPTFEKKLNDAEFSAVSSEAIGILPTATEYRRIFITKLACPVYGTSYGRLNKRNQSVIKYANADDILKFGVVHTFVQVENEAKSVLNLALVHPLLSAKGTGINPRKCCHEVTKRDANCIKAVPLISIQKVCSLVDIGQKMFVTEFPNNYEKD